MCYNCDEPCRRGHNCQKKQLFMIVGDNEENPNNERSIEKEMSMRKKLESQAMPFRVQRHYCELTGYIKQKPIVYCYQYLKIPTISLIQKWPKGLTMM